MADDHAAHAIGAYGSAINETPGIDRLAREGMRFDACFCTNSICSPSRATILTGTYNHVNGVTTLDTHFDAGQPAFPGMLRDAGYQTALIGKWHLGHGGIHDPAGFDHWTVLPDQGAYHDPTFLGPNGREVMRRGYATDLITDLALEWIDATDPHRPFLAMIHHKAPHRSWEPAERHAGPLRRQPHPGAAHAARRLRRPLHRGRRGAHAAARPERGRPQGPRSTRSVRGRGAELAVPDATSRTTCAAWLPSTRTSPACLTIWTTTAGRTTPWWCTRAIRASFWVTTAGTTSASCTRSRCGCRSSCATRARSRPAPAPTPSSSTSTSRRPSSTWRRSNPRDRCRAARCGRC